MQKGHNFWQFKDHNSGRRHENQTNEPIFFICSASPNCLGNSFYHLKIAKIHFHGVPPWKYLNFSGESCEIRILSRSIKKIYTLRKVKNQVLIFLSSWEQIPKFQGDLMVYYQFILLYFFGEIISCFIYIF